MTATRPRSRSGPLRVLFVDDSDDDVVLILRELTRGGYDVSSRRVDSPEATRGAVTGEQWDIVIADHNMPGFSSLDALAIVRESGHDFPFIIVSGFIGEDIAVEAMKAGAHDYIMKGNLARLVPAIERELREASVRRARRQAEALLRYQANHDALTGLLNRREFERRLQEAIRSARDSGRHHAVAYMDLDQFKIVNDTCGHIAGDELLRQAAGVLREHLRESDVLARLGGDEFGILVENCSLRVAQRLMANMIDGLHAARFSWLDKTFDIGASIGLVAIDPETVDVGAVLAAADLACYAAKDRGRNRVHVYQPDDQELSRRHGEMHWVTRITRALDEWRFRLYWQRIQPLGRGPRRPHYEVLLRLAEDDGRLIPPGAFIPAAERYNLMPAIDRRVVERAMRFVHRRAAADVPDGVPKLAVNLSGTTLNDDQFLDFVRQQLAQWPVPAHSICFEVTETAAITNLAAMRQFITELKALGFQFSLDDFGSGLSSFAYLKSLPVDYLKVDGTFVKDVTQDPIDRAMVEAINRIGHVMGLHTIAEFVENDEVLAVLTEIGVDYAQGYGIHVPEPMPLDD